MAPPGPQTAAVGLGAAPAGRTPFGLFAGSLGLWSAAVGMQQVLYSWLVLGELHANAEWMGTAQMLQSLPALLFLLIGGATADRHDRRRVLLVLHVAAATAAGVMGGVVAVGALGMGVLLIYGLGWGTTQALAQPARDAVISDVAGSDLMRAITAATLIQFIAAALGARLAGWAAHLGTPAALSMQAALLLLGFVLLLFLPAMPPLGTIAGSIVVLLRRGIRRRGRVFLLALLGVALCLVALSAQPPLWGFMLVVFAWGVFHSLFLNTSRTLFQETAPASHRARVLSIHSLGLLGMAPISNLAAGFLGRLLGPGAACGLAGGAMVLIVAAASALSDVRRMD